MLGLAIIRTNTVAKFSVCPRSKSRHPTDNAPETRRIRRYPSHREAGLSSVGCAPHGCVETALEGGAHLVILVSPFLDSVDVYGMGSEREVGK